MKWPSGKIATTLKKVDELMIPPDGIRRKLNEVVDGVLPGRGCKVLD